MPASSLFPGSRGRGVPLAVTAAGLGVVVVYPFIASGALQSVVYDALGIAAAVVITIAASRRAAAEAGPWRMLAIGIGLQAVGNVTYDAMEATGPVPVPGLPDLFYLLGYLALAAAIWRLLWHRGESSEDLLDTFVIGAAVAIALWILLVDPALDEGSVPLIQLATIAAYPAADVALAVLVAVPLFSMGGSDRRALLLVAAALSFLVSDIAYAIALPIVGYAPGLMDVGWLVGYVLWAVAALTVSPAELRVRDTPRWSPIRMVLLVGAAAVPFVILVGKPADANDMAAAGVTSLILFAVVVYRVDLVVRHQRELLTERQMLEGTVARQAVLDRLTDLPNREYLQRHLEQVLLAQPAGIVLMVLDIDDFAALNDVMGSPAGDTTLRVIARRLEAQLAVGDLAARVAGDVFAVVVGGGLADREITSLADRLVMAVGAPIDLGTRSISVTASIGIARSDRALSSSGHVADDLWREATRALADAKSRGGHSIVSLDADQSRLAIRRLSLASELSRAVAEREFVLHYQPIVSLRTGRIEAFEALIRWNHPALGLLSPSEFLPALARSVQMAAVGRWILEEACHSAAGWGRLGHGEVGIHVNVSPIQLEDDLFVRDLRTALAATSLPADRLTLEILESALDSTGAVLDRLTELRLLGVGLAVDDFGTGYSSLTRVADLHASVLKLDRSLVQEAADARTAEGALMLARRFGMRVVAEGVETIDELQRMRGIGCDAVQGYLTGRPVAIGQANKALSAPPILPTVRSKSGHRPRGSGIRRTPSSVASVAAIAP